jgi:hypothetical protein
MASYPRELVDLEHYAATPAPRRLHLAHELAEELGAGWLPLDGLHGTAGLPALHHEASGIDFVAVPGGRFVMGLRDDDLDELGRYLDWRAEHPTLEAHMLAHWRPTREVLVAPFLCGRCFVSSRQRMFFSPDDDESTEFVREETHRFGSSEGFRLPSEAELEWVAREGGSLHFTCDVGRKSAALPLHKVAVAAQENGFGLLYLLLGEWAEDDWHSSYVAAPTTSEAWGKGELGGVLRGALPAGLDELRSLPYGLAAFRVRGAPPEDPTGGEGVGGVRLVRSLPDS